jgi:hypothetical protein
MGCEKKQAFEEALVMEWKSSWPKMLLALITLCAWIAGCAHTDTLPDVEKERVLAAAGFQVKFADTPEKMELLKSLPQRTIFVKEKDGKDHYVHADGASCKCVYVGDEKAYQRARQLAAQQQLNKEDIRAAQMYRDAQMNWAVWGPWGPWY